MSVFTGMPGTGRREAAEFAALLESGRVPADHDLADLVALARTLAPVEQAPAPEFRASLRERLVTEAATRAPTVPAPRTAPGAAPASRPRLRNAVATIALASVVTGAGAAVASTRALPGDVLYDLKRQIENVELSLAGSDLGRGRELLEQADTRLGEAERLAASSAAADPDTRRALATALDEMQAATDGGALALTDSYRETGDPEPMVLLDRFLTEQQERPDDLLVVLDPSLRARVLAALDRLARVGNQTRAVLASATEPVTGLTAGDAGRLGRESGDGWAVSRLLDHTASLAGGTAPGAAVAGSEGLDPAAGGGTRGTGSGGGPLDDLVDGVTRGSGGGTGTGTGTGGATGGPAGATSVPTLLPLPSVSVPPTPPLPSTPPLPTVEPSTVTPPLPLPSVSACVPLPPLTTC